MNEIRNIPIEKLHPFPDHPFSVRDDEEMLTMIESVKEYGILTPVIVRPEEDGYEIISGHRRVHAAELAGIKEVPAIVKNIDRDAAIIIMVDSNLQREYILPSEKAKAYKMKMEAIKHQGVQNIITCGQVGHKSESEKSRDNITDTESGRTVQRYIHLNDLEPELLKLVDDKKLAITSAVELSYLRRDDQRILIDTIDSEQSIPSLSQAQRLRKMSRDEGLDNDKVLSVMMEQKKPEKMDIVIPYDMISRYVPRAYTPRDIQKLIIKLLDFWQKSRNKSQEYESRNSIKLDDRQENIRRMRIYSEKLYTDRITSTGFQQRHRIYGMV